MIRQIGLLDELVDLLALAVCKRVHRVDHDGAGARRFATCTGTNRGIDDRDEETHRLARPGTGRDDEALSARRLGNRLGLVPVEGDRSRVDAKHLCRSGVE